MSTCVNTIKWLFWMLVVTFALTYVISINVENHFISINSKWISNDFLFAIAGGAFASLLIVLICEIVKYRQQKFITETALFTNLGTLYGQILIIKNNCKRVFNSQEIVSEGLIQSHYAATLVDNINGIDYAPLYNNKTREILNQFKLEKHFALKSAIDSFIFFRIAIGEDKISSIKQGKGENVGADAPNVNKVLNKIISQTSTILIYLDQIISQIDDEFGNRYNWQQLKKSMSNYQKSYVPQELSDYLKEDVVIFKEV